MKTFRIATVVIVSVFAASAVMAGVLLFPFVFLRLARPRTQSGVVLTSEAGTNGAMTNGRTTDRQEASLCAVA